MSRNNSAIDWEEIRRRLAESQASMEQAFLPSSGQTRKILDLRARHLQNRSLRTGKARFRDKSIICFQAGGERFGIEISRLKAVVRLQDLTPLPAATPEILGIISIHGAIWTVLDLATAIGLGPADRISQDYALLLRCEDQNIALAIETMGELTSVPEADFATLQIQSDTAGGHYSAGLLPGRINLLNADAFCEQNHGGEAV